MTLVDDDGLVTPCIRKDTFVVRAVFNHAVPLLSELAGISGVKLERYEITNSQLDHLDRVVAELQQKILFLSFLTLFCN
jgi:hypothetical protein